MTHVDEVRGPWRPRGTTARFGSRAFAHPTEPTSLVWLPSGGGLLTFAAWAVWHWADDGELLAVWPVDPGDAPRGEPVASMVSSSDDGRVVALPFDDGSLRVLQGGVWEHGRFPSSASCLAVAPSGLALWFGTTDGRLVVTTPLGRALRRARVTNAAVSRVVPLSEDDALVCSSTDVARVRLADLSVVWRDAQGARSVAVSPARDRVAVDTPRTMDEARDDELHTVVARDGAVTWAASGPVRVLDAADGGVCGEVLPAEHPTRFFAFATSDELIGASDRELVVARVGRDAQFRGVPWCYPGFVATACASPTGDALATLHTGSRFVHLWDPRSASARGDAREAPRRLTPTSDGRVHSDDGRVFDPRSGATTAWLPTTDPGHSPRVAVSPDGRRAVVVRSPDGVEVVDLERPTEARLVPVRGTVMDAAWSTDGRSIVVWLQVHTHVDTTHMLWEFDLETDARTQLPLGDRDGWTGAQLACGARGAVYVAPQRAAGIAWRPDALAWWDGAQWCTTSTEDDVAPCVRRAPAPRGEATVLAVGADGALVLRDLTSCKPLWTLDATLVTPVAFHHARGRLARGWLDGRIEVWDIATGRRSAQARHGFAVRALAFSVDGRHLVSSDDDGTVLVWDLAALEASEVGRDAR